MQLQGQIIAKLEPKTGVSQKGDWKKQEFVVETHEQYPKKMVFTVFGQDKLERFNLCVGNEVEVLFDIDAREWNGRWFNDIKAWDVKKLDPASVGDVEPPTQMLRQPAYQQPTPQPMPPTMQAAVSMAEQKLGAQVVGQQSDDLPF